MNESKYISIGAGSNLASVANLLVLLNNNLGELVKAEKEKNDILKGIKNKLSDIVAVNVIDSSCSTLMYTDSEEGSGFEPSFLTKRYNIYNYYNDSLKQKEDDTDGSAD